MWFQFKKLWVSTGFILLTIWFAVSNGLDVLLLILGAVTAHELGHLVALHLFGANIETLKISVLGAVLEADCKRLSYGKELTAVLAGPAMNLVCACLLSHFVVGAETVVGIHLVLGGFNLFPIRPLDGGRGLELLLTWVFGPYAGEVITCRISALTAILLAVFISYLMYATGGSLWLLPAVVGLLGIAGRECLGKR